MVNIRWLVLLLFFSSFALVVPVAAVEPPALAWNMTLGGNSLDRAYAVDQTNDGGYVVAGYTHSNQTGDVGLNHGLTDYLVVRLDSVGHKVWSVTLGGSGYDEAHAVQQTSDGGYVVVGGTDSDQSGDVGLNHGSTDMWVVKLNSAGQKVWNVTLGGSSSDEAYAVDQTSDDGYVVAGLGGVYGDDFWVVKLDAAGEKVWDRPLGGYKYDRAYAVQQTSDEGYVIAGSTESNEGGVDIGMTNGGEDFWVVKLDSAGQKVWNTTLGGTEDERASAVQQTSDGGYVVVGYTDSNQTGDVGLNHGGVDFWGNPCSDVWVVKLGSDGQKVWNRTLGGSGYDEAHAVQQTKDGGYIVAGYTHSSQSGDVGLNHGLDDYWVVKLDSAGQKVWNKTLGGTKDERASAVQQTSDGGYVVAGYTNSDQSGDVGLKLGGFWVVKLMAESTGPGPTLLAVPGGAALPSDTNADGKYDDVNGNGRGDFADVVLYFNQMTWIADHEPVSLFDYNGNGRIDFADVVWLFNHL